MLPPYAINALGAVLTHGAEKYGDRSWKQVEPERYTGALLRHVMAYLDGEITDPDSGMPHLWHVLCNAAFLVELTREEEQDVLESSMRSELVVSTEELFDRFGNPVTIASYGYRTIPLEGSVEFGNAGGMGRPDGSPDNL